MATLQLVAQDHAPSTGRDLVENVDALHDPPPPIGNAALVDDHIQRVGSIPGFEDEGFVEILGQRDWVPLKRGRLLVYQINLFIEIESEAVPASKRPFVNNLAGPAEVRIQIL